MNAITITTTVPVAYDPGISGLLSTSLRMFENGASLAVLPPGVVREARARLGQLGPLLAPVTKALVWAWLEDLAKARLVNTPPDLRGVYASANAIWETCTTLPGSVWTKDTRVAFQAGHRFWPTPADVFGHLTPFAEHLRRQRSGCQTILKAWEDKKGIEAAAVITPPSKEAVEAVAAAVASLRVCHTGNFFHGAPARPQAASERACPLSDAQLLASHEEIAQNGTSPDVRAASALRATVLRRKLGIPPA